MLIIFGVWRNDVEIHSRQSVDGRGNLGEGAGWHGCVIWEAYSLWVGLSVTYTPHSLKLGKLHITSQLEMDKD